MVQIPDNVKPVLAIIAKYHFWMLAAVAPLVLLPVLFLANGRLQAEIKSTQGQIRSRFDALRQVQGIAPHPNQGWSKDIDSGAGLVRQETLAQWKAFWDSQAFLRVWPKDLGDDFLAAAKDLKPDGKLDRNMLQRYQNRIQEVIKKFPARMGVDELMSAAVDAASQPATRAAAAPAGSQKRKSPCQWDAADQKRLLDSFAWQELPSTAKVVLAQEELWVEGALCDIIAGINKQATGTHDVPVIRVDELSVGYPAAEDQPGGAGGKRIFLPSQPANADATGGMQPGGDSKRPAHPRFGARETKPARQAGDQPESADDPLRNWIYVDFSGKPLMAAELATSPAAQMVHLMPFTMRIVINEQKLDALLVALATAPLPIDVRQVRINAGGGPAAAASTAAGTDPSAGGGRRPFDVVVELRGTVGLATPPNPKLLGIEPQAAPGGEQQPAADVRRIRRREAA
jgi:hypothetical protein